MQYLYYYSVSILAILVISSLLHEDSQVKEVCLLIIIWPAVVVLMFTAILLDVFNVRFDIKRSSRWFSARKSVNEKVAGFAITIFKHELQFWKDKKG